MLVLDLLNTHSLASRYAAFPPAEAMRLAEKLEIHHTPQHGSWLNMVELELSVLQRQCLRQRITDRDVMARAARLGGAAEEILASVGAVLSPSDRADDASYLAAAEAVLGPDHFAVLWAEGRALPPEDVTAKVFAGTDPVAAPSHMASAGAR